MYSDLVGSFVWWFCMVILYGDFIWWFLYVRLDEKISFLFFHYNMWSHLFPPTPNKITISKSLYQNHRKNIMWHKITISKSPYPNHIAQCYSITHQNHEVFGYFIIILMVVLVGDLRDLVGSFVWWFCMVIFI